MASAASTSSTPASWSNFFIDKTCTYSGEVATKTDVKELIREYSLRTTTTFAVWRTEKKSFGSTGNSNFWYNLFCLFLTLAVQRKCFLSQPKDNIILDFSHCNIIFYLIQRWFLDYAGNQGLWTWDFIKTQTTHWYCLCHWSSSTFNHSTYTF